MTTYQIFTTVNNLPMYNVANTYSNSYCNEPIISYRTNTSDSANEGAHKSLSALPTLDSVISLALSYPYVIGARAFEWQGSIVLALITTPFILKSERDNAKSEIIKDIIAATCCENIVVSLDGEVYRNIRDGIDDNEKSRLYRLAMSRI